MQQKKRTLFYYRCNNNTRQKRFIITRIKYAKDRLPHSYRFFELCIAIFENFLHAGEHLYFFEKQPPNKFDLLFKQTSVVIGEILQHGIFDDFCGEYLATNQ